MSNADGLWSDNVDREIARMELRLEQYRIHADGLDRRSRNREGVDALMKGMKERLRGLKRWRDTRRVQ
jgi:hypothetical protein